MARTGKLVTAGVDGFKAGWVVAFLEDARPGLRARIAVAERFEEVRDCTADCDAVGVDIPIGLSDDGGRKCDSAARRILRDRASSVFPAPVRAVLAAKSHEEANRISQRAAGVGITAQAFALVPKILEVDEVITRRLQARIFEVHPELCFQQALNAGKPLGFPKRSAIGAVQRLRLLQDVGVDAHELVREWEGSATPRLAGKVGLDDLLDALAAAWSARRKAQGLSKVVTEEIERDAKGLLMQMFW